MGGAGVDEEEGVGTEAPGGGSVAMVAVYIDGLLAVGTGLIVRDIECDENGTRPGGVGP